MTELKTKPFDTLEVGKTYLSTCQKSFKIDKYTLSGHGGDLYCFYSGGLSFTKFGRFNIFNSTNDLDLIAEVIDKPVYPVKAGSEVLYHDLRVPMEEMGEIGEIMAQDGEFAQSQAKKSANAIWVNSKPTSTGHILWSDDYSSAYWKNPPSGKFSPEQYRATLDDFIHGGDSKDTRDVIKDALRVMGGV
jgi:hypothetical protein